MGRGENDLRFAICYMPPPIWPPPVSAAHKLKFPYLESMMSESEGELTRLVDQLNRSAANSNRGGELYAGQVSGFGVHRQASDIILVVGSPAVSRIKGILTAETGAVLSATDLRNLLFPMLSAAQQCELHERKSLDLYFVRNAIGKLRAKSALSQHTGHGDPNTAGADTISRSAPAEGALVKVSARRASVGCKDV
jgi:hypothetical protein